MASSSTSRPLRSSWRPTKKIVGPSVGQGVGLREALDLDAVEHQLVVAAERAAAAAVRPPTPRTHAEAVGQPREPPAERSGRRRSRPRRGRCRPSGRRRTGARSSHGPGTSGSCRCTTSKASSRRARMVRSWHDGSGAIGATEPLAAVGIDRPSGVTPASGGGPSHGPSTRTSWPEVRSARAKPEHLALHAAGHRQAVRADQADRTASRYPASGGLARWSEGQLGCRRCHCSGAWRMSASSSSARAWVSGATSSRKCPWRSRDRRPHDAVVAAVAVEVDGRRGDGRRRCAAPGSPARPAGSCARRRTRPRRRRRRCRGRTAGTQVVGLQRPEHRGARCRAEGHDRPCRATGAARRTTRTARAARPARPRR